MRKRKRISLRVSKLLAKRTAKRTRKANILRKVSRGGLRF